MMDLCSRRVMSWAFSDKPNSELTTRALRLAIEKRQINGQVVFHSGQGSQYTRATFQSSLKEYGIEPFYNQKRRHYKLGNISPAQFERNLWKTA